MLRARLIAELGQNAVVAGPSSAASGIRMEDNVADGEGPALAPSGAAAAAPAPAVGVEAGRRSRGPESDTIQRAITEERAEIALLRARLHDQLRVSEATGVATGVAPPGQGDPAAVPMSAGGLPPRGFGSSGQVGGIRGLGSVDLAAAIRAQLHSLPEVRKRARSPIPVEKPGLKKMYKHNLVIRDAALAGLEEMNRAEPDPEVIMRRFTEVRDQATQRLKIIEIAEKYGWDAVAEYQQDRRLGDDPEDAKRIRQAATEAQAKRKRAQALRRGPGNRGPGPYSFRGSWNGTSGPGFPFQPPSGPGVPPMGQPGYPFGGQVGGGPAPFLGTLPGLAGRVGALGADPGSRFSASYAMSGVISPPSAQENPPTVPDPRSDLTVTSSVINDLLLTRLTEYDKVPSIFQFLVGSRSASTVRAYGYNIKAFINWCKKSGASPFPASVQTVMIFLAHLAHISSFNAASQGYAALLWVHDLLGLNHSLRSRQLALLLEGIKRSYAQPSKKKMPATSEIIHRLFLSLKAKGDLFSARTLSFITLAYFGFLRGQEVLNLKYGDLEFQSKYLKVVVRRSKTDQLHKGAEILIANSGLVVNPYEILRDYLLKLDLFRIGNLDAYIFPRMTRGTSKILPRFGFGLSQNRMRELLLAELAALGIYSSSYGLHSFRRGGATDAARAGVLDRIFQKHGRWKSAEVKNSYIAESNEDLLFVTQQLVGRF